MGWGASSVGRGQTTEVRLCHRHPLVLITQEDPTSLAHEGLQPPQTPGCHNLLRLQHPYDLGVNICASRGVRMPRNRAVLRSPSACCRHPLACRDASARRAGRIVRVRARGNSGPQRRVCSPREQQSTEGGLQVAFSGPCLALVPHPWKVPNSQ